MEYDMSLKDLFGPRLGSAARACISSVVLPVLEAPPLSATSPDPRRRTNRKQSACARTRDFARITILQHRIAETPARMTCTSIECVMSCTCEDVRAHTRNRADEGAAGNRSSVHPQAMAGIGASAERSRFSTHDGALRGRAAARA